MIARMDLAPPASAMLGYLSERSSRHVAGWVQDSAAPGTRVAFDVVATRLGQRRVIAQGVADQFSHVLSLLGVGDARYAFRLHFAEPVSAAERDSIAVVPRASGMALPLDPALRTHWEPLTHVAMDIVDNCNLRCPFCLYDYEGVNRTNLMTPATYAAALRLLPFVGPGQFWLSCLHEPTLHPQFAAMIDAVPQQFREKIFYTTNLAKRMPAAYYATLAASRISHLNVSIESRDPALYERLRKGARHRIFAENWDLLLGALGAGTAAPRLRYIAMAYRSNLRELPGLVAHLLAERRAWNIEIRDTYDKPHLPPGFRAAEFLTPEDWRWLRAELAHHPVQQVTIAGPEPVDAGAAEDAPPIERPPGLAGMRISWEGNMVIKPSPDQRHPQAELPRIMMNIAAIDDVEGFLARGWFTRTG